MKLEVGKRYTIKYDYNKPSEKYFRGLPSCKASELRGKTLKCFKLSASGASAWFRYGNDEFWVKDQYLKEAPSIPKTRKTPRITLTPYLKMEGRSFIITKPKIVAPAFWLPGMDKYVGQMATVIKEGPSKWVKVHADGGGYMWNKDWLKPVAVAGKDSAMKVRKLTLQEELMAIDAKYDTKIRNIKYRSGSRQAEIARKARDYKNYLARDKTEQNLDKYINRTKDSITATKTSWRSKLRKFALPALGVSVAVGGVVYGALTLL